MERFVAAVRRVTGTTLCLSVISELTKARQEAYNKGFEDGRDAALNEIE